MNVLTLEPKSYVVMCNGSFASGHGNLEDAIASVECTMHRMDRTDNVVIEEHNRESSTVRVVAKVVGGEIEMISDTETETIASESQPKVFHVTCDGILCWTCRTCERAIVVARKICHLNNVPCYVEINHPFIAGRRIRICRVTGFETTLLP